MVYRAMGWTWQRLRPQEGWLAVLLLLIAAGLLTASVNEAGWVPEGMVAGWSAFLGLLLAMVLANRRWPWWAAWALIVLYGLVLTTIYLGRLWPPAAAVGGGWGATAQYIRQNWALMIDRINGWLAAALGGGRSEETIVFAFGLGWLAWLLAAYAAWTTLRQHRPLAGLTAMGLALAVNGYFGSAPAWLVALFVGLTALLAAAVHFADLAERWDSRQVDYSNEIRLELLMVAAAVSLLLLSLAFIVPAINFRALSRLVLDQPVVTEAEETLGRIFAGVQPPRLDLTGEGPGAGGAGSAFDLPNTFLLGNAPELSETVVMTATVAGPVPPAIHWRGRSYDFYTGRGWSNSTQRRETIPAGQPIPLPEVQDVIPIDQSVYGLPAAGSLRFTLGLPRLFDQPAELFWRGADDLGQARGTGGGGPSGGYAAVSQASAAPAEALRQARLADVPGAILARYTELPDGIPQRVFDLAQQAAGTGALTPYDQALALERFLRQYPYSLDVSLPPPGTDPVDFFLFELQTGYCDYYASAMAVMARSLGLPARVASGFLAQPADDRGVQTIYQINAHSWAEIYFAGYGWIEFEPTPAFPAQGGSPIAPDEAGGLPPEFATPPPIPEAPAAREVNPWPWLWWLALPIAILGWWLWWRRVGRIGQIDRVAWIYGLLRRSGRRLGLVTPASQTPAEFSAAFQERLARLAGRSQLAARLLGPIAPGRVTVAGEIDDLANLFAHQQYAPAAEVVAEPAAVPAAAGWQRIRRRLWLLTWWQRLSNLLRRET
jgi:transglutaminase-like putative cysteine protease